MIQEFVDRFFEKKSELALQFAAEKPSDYKSLVTAVVKIVAGDSYGAMNHEDIHEVCIGDYQGTLVFVIPARGYQPSDVWYVTVSYGSCSGCDTLEAIHDSGKRDLPPNEEQVKDYMTLALHIVQNLRKMYETESEH